MSRPCPRPVRRRRCSAFTLVELLVVIGIIALLMSILLPTLGRVREQASAIKCASNLRQVGQAFHMYANENKGKLPEWNASRSWTAPYKSSDWVYWQINRDLGDSAVMRYVGANPELLRCPSDLNWEFRPLNGNSAAVGPYKFSYAVNVYMLPNTQVPTRYQRALVLSTVRNASKKILAVEEDERTLNDGIWMPLNNGDPNAATPNSAPNDYLAIRHDRTRIEPDNASNWARNLERRGNAVFLDAHVEYVSRTVAHDVLSVDPFRN